MKSNSGITLMTLIIYIIGMIIIIGIVAFITNFVQNNILKMEDSSNIAAEFSKFNLVFIEEVKTYGNEIEEITDNSVSFTSGNKYLFQDGKIYKNKIEIASNINQCRFKLRTNEYKQIISVYIELGTKNSFSKTMDYVLSYEEEKLSNPY